MILKKDKETVEEKDNTVMNGNSLILSNSILLIPLIYVMVESLNKFNNVRTLILIFGLILIGCLLTSNFLAMFSNQLNSLEKRKKLLFVSYLLSCSMYFLLFIFIMVIMIIM